LKAQEEKSLGFIKGIGILTRVCLAAELPETGTESRARVGVEETTGPDEELAAGADLCLVLARILN
jgi:hypothetical protein